MVTAGISAAIRMVSSFLRVSYSARKAGFFLFGLSVYCALKTLVYITEQTTASQQTVDPPWTSTPPTANPVLTSRHEHGTDKQHQSADRLRVSTRAPSQVTCYSQHLGLPQYVTDRTVSCSNSGCEAFTCQNFLFGNGTQSYYKAAENWMKRNPKKIKPDMDFVTLAQNCTAFRVTRGYHLHPVNKEEANFPIAFNILMHKDVEQVEKLLRVIYRPQNVYCVHIDSKASVGTNSAIRAISQCFSNVVIASKLERVVYAGFSRLQADINCMKDLVKTSIKWHYLINIAGQAFPLKSNAEMVKVLKVYNGTNDIEGMYGRRVLRGRFENEWKEAEVQSAKPSMKKTGVKNPKPPYEIDIVRGSAYGVFSRQFVDYLLTDEKPLALLEWSRNTWSPDEHYWATLHHTYSNPHLKPPGGYSGTYNNARIFY